LYAAKGLFFLIAFNQVLATFRADLFEQEPQMPQQRIVAQDRMVLLPQIMNANQGQRAKDGCQYEHPRRPKSDKSRSYPQQLQM
jgi:hypothetical protein